MDWVRTVHIDNGRLISTHSLTADVGMPHLRVKLHVRRLERVHIRDLNVDDICSSSVRGIWRPWNSALEVCEIAGVDGRGTDSRVVFVRMNVGQLLDDPAFSGGGHVEVGRDAWTVT